MLVKGWKASEFILGLVYSMFADGTKEIEDCTYEKFDMSAAYGSDPFD